jgi:predicted RNA-binding Zn-ribbon protein involved in translation (DUF1610 family)
MHISQPVVAAKYPITRRTCPNCGKDMMIIRIMPDRPGFQQRTFECVNCGNETVIMASSAWLGRLNWVRLD